MLPSGYQIQAGTIPKTAFDSTVKFFNLVVDDDEETILNSEADEVTSFSVVLKYPLQTGYSNLALYQPDGTTRTGLEVQDLTVYGNLVVSGGSFEVDSEISTSDSVIQMNDGEVGAGVTLGYSGLHIDRGSLNPFWIGFDEVRDGFSVGQITGLSDAQIATTQLVATRQDAPTSNGLMYWNDTDKRIDSSSILITNINTIGQSVLTSANPSAITFGRANADNTVDWLSAADFRTAIGAGTTTLSFGTANQVPHMNAGGTDFDYDVNYAWDGTNLLVGGTLTIPSGSSLVRAGAHSLTFSTAANTFLNLPTTGTLATLAGAETFTNKTWNGVAIDDAYISSAETWNAKQDALSGSGVVFSTTGTISYKTIGTDIQAYSADLNSLATAGALTGIISRTGSATYSYRTLTGTANEITVTNGDGLAGAPTFSLPSALTLTGKTITGGTYSSGTWQGTAIDDAYISSAATWNAKLTSTLASANIFVGSAGNVATGVAMSGDIGIDNTGLTSISSGVIVNGDVNASAAIAGTKISPDFGAQNIVTTGSLTAGVSSFSRASILGANSAAITDASSTPLGYTYSNSAAESLFIYGGNISFTGWSGMNFPARIETYGFNSLEIGNQQPGPVIIGTNNLARLTINGDGSITAGSNSFSAGAITGTSVTIPSLSTAGIVTNTAGGALGTSIGAANQYLRTNGTATGVEWVTGLSAGNFSFVGNVMSISTGTDPMVIEGKDNTYTIFRDAGNPNTYNAFTSGGAIIYGGEDAGNMFSHLHYSNTAAIGAYIDQYHFSTITDSGTQPVVQYSVFKNSTPAAIATRPTFAWYNNTTKQMQLFADGGLAMASLSSMGAGTINANAVYDNGAILTDYVFEKYHLGKPVEDRYSYYVMKSLNEEILFVKENLHLSTMIGRKEWEEKKGASLGTVVSGLWQTVETHHLYLSEHEIRIQELEKENNKLKKQIELLNENTTN